MSTLRVGVVGVGSLGFHHARILSSLSDADLVGIHDIDPARLADVGDRLDARTFRELDELARLVDAAVVAVPTSGHEAVACALLRRGVHVLIEKPIAPSLDAADRILEAAAASGATVQIGHVERFNGALRAAEQYLEEPLFVECHRLAPFAPRGTDVAVVLDLMIHDLDLVLSLMKRPVTAMAAVGVGVLTPTPDIANARLEFEGGGVANLTASRVSLERTRKIRFFQRSGYLSLDLANGRGEFLRLRPGAQLAQAVAGIGGGVGAPSPAAAGSAGVPGDSGGHPAAGALAGLAGLAELVERIPLESDGAEPLRCELESFVAAALGHAPVAVTGEEGRRALAVALEIIGRIERNVEAASTP
ncbi:MAG TPA: Gfo/Idh/MocA family oxidoreductase [Longimicrobiales bacterium]|nr:Gfo/Idh/MocA family oxidoreductase [Longimicrobiales bacterium]